MASIFRSSSPTALLQLFVLIAVFGSLLAQTVPDYLPLRSFVLTVAVLFWIQLVAWATWRVILYPKFFSPLRHLPHPSGDSFFMGQWGRIAAEPSGDPMKAWNNEIPNDGLIYYRGLFNQDRVFITSPRGLSEILTQKSYEFIKPPALTYGIGRLLGYGVVLAEGNEHKVQRKNLMPSFSYRRIKDLYPVFWSKTREVTEAVTSTIIKESKATQADDRPFSVIEVNDWCSRATLDIIGIAGIGQDFYAIADPDTELNKTYRIVFKPSKEAKALQLLALFLPLWLIRRLPVQRNGDIEAAAGVIKKLCHQVIKQKREKLEKDQDPGTDILALCMKSGGFSDSNLIDQMMTFLAAGHETTSSSLTWAVYLLCQHPNIQRRLREEIRNNVQPLSDDTPLDAAVIDNLPYLHAVCNEVLRFYPAVPVTVRESAAPGTTILGQPIPQGTRIMLSPWATNKSTALWGPDAAEFKPDRWMGPGRANTGGADSNYAFMTFLHGPRSCIGQGFAKAEFACLLAGLVGRFEMDMADKDFVLSIKGGITAKPANGLAVKMTVLEGW